MLMTFFSLYQSHSISLAGALPVPAAPGVIPRDVRAVSYDSSSANVVTLNLVRRNLQATSSTYGALIKRQEIHDLTRRVNFHLGTIIGSKLADTDPALAWQVDRKAVVHAAAKEAEKIAGPKPKLDLSFELRDPNNPDEVIKKPSVLVKQPVLVAKQWVSKLKHQVAARKAWDIQRKLAVLEPLRDFDRQLSAKLNSPKVDSVQPYYRLKSEDPSTSSGSAESSQGNVPVELLKSKSGK